MLILLQIRLQLTSRLTTQNQKHTFIIIIYYNRSHKECVAVPAPSIIFIIIIFTLYYRLHGSTVLADF